MKKKKTKRKITRKEKRTRPGGDSKRTPSFMPFVHYGIPSLRCPSCPSCLSVRPSFSLCSPYSLFFFPYPSVPPSVAHGQTDSNTTTTKRRAANQILRVERDSRPPDNHPLSPFIPLYSIENPASKSILSTLRPYTSVYFFLPNDPPSFLHSHGLVRSTLLYLPRTR